MCYSDTLLALAHTAAVNTSDDDRIAIFFRVWRKDIEAKRLHYLTNLWSGWKLDITARQRRE